MLIMGEAGHECMVGGVWVVEEISISSTFVVNLKLLLKEKKSSLFKKKNVHVIEVKWHE